MLLRLAFRVVDISTCLPIPNAAIDIWHCDALGIYSHFINANFSSAYHAEDNSTFLRGVQYTDLNGEAEFFTIFPGWYSGRDTHIHLKVYLNHTLSNSSGVFYSGHVAHSGQLFFNDTLTDNVYGLLPYRSINGTRVRLTEDYMYQQNNGSLSLLTVQYIDPTDIGHGLLASITLGIDGRRIASISSPTASMIKIVHLFSFLACISIRYCS